MMGSWEGWRKYRRKGKSCVKKRVEKTELEEDIYRTVIFVQHTERSILAKRIREKLQKIEDSGGG